MMRIFITGLIAACATLAFAVDGQSDNSPDFVSGTFVGCAVSDEHWVPITTTLEMTDGVVSGRYIFIEPTGNRVPGTLAAAPFAGRGDIAMQWTDIYGTGGVSLTFSAGGNRFDGYWTPEGEPGARYPWNGVRSGSGLKTPDCTVPVS